MHFVRVDWGLRSLRSWYGQIFDIFVLKFLQEEKALRNNKRYSTLDTRKDGIRFTNSSLKQLNDEFQTYRETYNDVQSNLAQEVLKVAGK